MTCLTSPKQAQGNENFSPKILKAAQHDAMTKSSFLEKRESRTRKTGSINVYY